MQKFEIRLQSTGEWEVSDNLSGESILGKCQEMRKVLEALEIEDLISKEEGEPCRTSIKLVENK